MNPYRVFKRTATHPNTLAATGAADVLRQLDPRIVELEGRFEIRLRTGRNAVRYPSDNRMHTILARLKAYAGPNKAIAEFAKSRDGGISYVAGRPARRVAGQLATLRLGDVPQWKR